MIATDSVTRLKQQNSKELKSAYKIYKDTCEVDWSKPIYAIYNHIRGLSPYPAAWTTLINENKEISLKIYSAEKELVSHSFTTGHLVFDKNEMKVAVKNGYIKLLEIQLPGKRKMKTKEVLNGLKLDKNAKVL